MVMKLGFRFFLILSLFFSLNSTFAAEKNLEYLNLNTDSSLNTYKVSYYILYSEATHMNKFSLEIYHDGNLIDTCEKSLVYDSNMVSEKIMCEVPKKEGGEYFFIAKLLNDDDVVTTISNIEKIKGKTIYGFDKANSTIEFQDNEDSTTIIISVNQVGENLIVLNSIPKEVIADLNEKNKNELIDSKFNYKIIESDPLIAWSVDKAPTKINYTINKKVSLDEQRKFTIDVENDTFFNKLKWVVYILIFLIIVLALKSSFKKS